MKLDPEIVKILAVDPSNSSISQHGGAGMSSASTSKITITLDDGTTNDYFMKTGAGDSARVMFEGEHASLTALHDAVPSLCPRSLGWGRLSQDSSKYFLITEFLDLSGRHSASGRSLASKLAELHQRTAPIPEGFDKPMFGFPATTCCGDTPQLNDYKESWAEFFAQNRLRFILQEAEKKNGKDQELRKLVTDTADKVVPRLLADAHLNNGKGVTPVVIHGDLWSGNASAGRIAGRGEIEEVVYDPSSSYSHNEFELGIMKMFGGFGDSFLKAYHKECPKTEPVEEYQDRIALYELYHHLNHYALFGGGYKSGASSIMRTLCKKYGSEKHGL